MAALALAATPSAAHAQPTKPATSAEDTATAEARARFDEGIKHAEAGDHEAARLKFNQAWALVKSPAILYNLARAEQLSGHAVEALGHYRQFVSVQFDPKVTEAQRRRVSEGIDELSKVVGQIEVVAPAGAIISVDGRLIEPGSRAPIVVEPGKHVVVAVANGKVTSVTIECPAGAITKASLIDRDEAGAADAAEPVSTRDEASEPTMSSEDTTTSFWTGGRVAGLAVFVGGLAALTTGVLFHQSASAAEAEATRIRDGLPDSRSSCNDPANAVPCAALVENVDTQTTHGDLGTAFLIGGAALAIGGAALFLVSAPSEEASRAGVRVVPFASRRGDAGLTVLGRF